MAQFIAFDQNVKVNGQTILSVINALNIGKETRMEILKKNGIDNPKPDQWYEQQCWLNAFKDIAFEIGEKTLYIIGKAIPENAKFPPEIDSLNKALESIDVAYHMNHKGGNIGHYKLTHFDAISRKAIMVCNNPYPSEFDRGIIMAMVAKFRPLDSFGYNVERDNTKETRTRGAESCTYIITW